jgi:hypothetical protein
MTAGTCAQTRHLFDQDCIKTRMQGEGSKLYSGTLDCAKQMMAKEGFTSFFAGSLPRCVQVNYFPCSFVVLVCVLGGFCFPAPFPLALPCHTLFRLA